MGTQNKEIKIALDIQAKIDKASSQIGALKKQIDNFELSKGLASDFAKEFKNIEHELAELQRKTASGEINLIDAKSAEKEIDKIEKRWAFLLSKIGGDGFLEKGLKTDAQAMTALESLAKSYANGIKEAEAQETKLNKKLDEAKQKQKELAETQKEQKVVKASELEDQKAQLAILEKQEKAAKKARDEAEKALRAKVEESGGKYSMDEISRKGSNLRKTDAYKTFRDAQSAYDSAKASTKAQKTNVGSMVTKEMQVAEAKAAQEAIDKATEALDNYRKTSLATAKEDAFEKAKESLKSIAEFKDIDWEGLDIDMSEIKSVEDLEKALEKLRVEADKRANAAIKEMETSTKEAGQGFKGLEEDIKNAKEGLEGMDEQARQTEAFEARIKQFLGMAGAVELLRRALRQAFETTKELDAAMTEMAVVTDLEVGDYWKQLPDHTKRASELGVAIKDVYEAETLYYQQGLKTAEAQELANTTLRMARIAGLDAAEATDKMTAALRGFKMELNEASAEKVADVYSELAAITAADVNEISTAMTKTASIASSAGMEFETTAAFLSQIIETTRESAETAGTAMKTVIARFSEVKKLQGEGLLTGSDEEGEVIDVNKIQTALRSVGISMDEFFAGTEGLDSIFLKLAEKWDTLDVKTQRYIATTAAGSRQQSRFIAMMSDYARTQELVTAANNSAGASQKQYEKTLESLESKLAQLKNAWDEFSMGILQSDLVKFGVDALKTFLEIINKATSALDGLGGTITKVLTTIALFKLGQKIFDGIKKPMANFFTKLVSDIYTEGTKAGQAFAKGVEDSQQTDEQKAQEKQEAEKQKRKEYLDVKEDKTVWQKTKDATGLSGLEKTPLFASQNNEEKAKFDNFKKMKANGGKKKLEKDYLTAKAEFDRVDSLGDKISKEGQDQALKNLDKAEEALINYKKTEEEVQIASQKGWEATGQSLQKVGTNVAAVGVGMSMLGGILSQLGLEEVGEGFSQIGNILTVVGGTISVLGTIVPVVSKIMAAAGFTVQAAWWPLLVALLAIAATVAIVAVVMAAIKTHNAKKLENRMDAAAEATEKAKEAAEKASQAYDDLLSAKEGYDELQKQISDLTRGTDEWREALRKSNEEVLELLQTYPELAKYLSRGEDGQLIISDEGWDAILEKQRKTVQNAQNAIMQRQFDEQELKREGLQSNEYKSNTTILTYDPNVEAMVPDIEESNKLRKELEHIYTSGLDASGIQKELERVSNQWNVPIENLQKAGEELEKVADDLNAIEEESEAIAKASLTATASNTVLGSEYGNAVIDTFANSARGESEQQAIAKKEEEIGANIDTSGNDYQDQEGFKALAEEYGVDNRMTGNDAKDVKTLYAAMQGITVQEVDESMTTEEMLKFITESEVANDRSEQMDKYVGVLEQLSKTDKTTADNIAGMFSDEGMKMTADFAKELVGEDGQQELNKEKIEEVAKSLNMTVDEWAASVGKTTDEFYKEIEKNARSNTTIITDTYDRLNTVLKKSGKDAIDSFGKDIVLSAENQKNLAENLINATQVVGQENADTLKTALDNALTAAGDKADVFANILNGMNWSSADDWEKLPELLNNFGIDATNSAIQNLINKSKEFNLQVKTIDINSLAEEIQGINELIKSIESGDQGRVFDQESYDKLVASNADLADNFIKVGDTFRYVGGSMDDLSNALKQNLYQEQMWAATQLEFQKKISDTAVAFDPNQEKIGDLKTDKDKAAYLDAFRDYAASQGVESLSFLTDASGQSVGMSLGTNFEQLDSNTLDKYINALKYSIDHNEDFIEEQAKALSDASVTLYSMMDVEENLQKAREFQGSDEKKADEYRKAISMQASESGMVAEEVIARYNELIQKEYGAMTDSEKTELLNLENTIKSGVKQSHIDLEKIRTVNNMTNKALEAIENIRQKEIDELSNINDSIKDAEGKLINQIQKQIDADRQARQNEKTEEDIAAQENRLSYLMQDTSGANALEILELQESIAAEKEDYQNAIIDQKLQQLSDENAAAAEQRERQIALLEAQLEHDRETGLLAQKAEEITIDSLAAINEGVNPLDTDLYQLLYASEELNGNVATEYQQEEFKAQFTKDSKESADAYDDINKELDAQSTDQDSQLTAEKAIKDASEAIQEYLYGKKNATTGEREGGVIDKEEQARKLEEENQTKRKIAINTASNTAGKLNLAGDSLKQSSSYQQQLDKYIAAGGNASDFYDSVAAQAQLGYTIKGISNNSVSSAGLNDKENAWFDLTIDGKTDTQVETGKKVGNTGKYSDLFKQTTGQEVQKGSVLVGKDNILYVYGGTAWYEVLDQGANLNSNEENRPQGLISKAKSLVGFNTGGLADFTGPAWLDGTKSNPELVLNARDTANFIQLKDILAEIMNGASSIKNNKTEEQNNNTFDIDITVEKISDDYDVEQMANKIRSMLYEDATYRNINSVSFIR